MMQVLKWFFIIAATTTSYKKLSHHDQKLKHGQQCGITITRDII